MRRNGKTPITARTDFVPDAPEQAPPSSQLGGDPSRPDEFEFVVHKALV